MSAQKPVIITDSVDVYPLGLHLALLEDKTGQLKIEDVTSSNYYNKFITSQSKSPNFGHTTSAVWARFIIQNDSTTTKEWILEIAYPMMRKVDFYLPHNNGTYTEIKSGVTIPLKKRQYGHRNMLFYIPVGQKNLGTLFLRIETETALVFPATLWSKDAFYKKDHNEQMVFGFYYGILFVMIFYNLFIFLSLRDISYLYYVIFVSCHALYQLFFNGLALEYFSFIPVEWSAKSMLFFGMLFLFGYSQFTRKFLLTNKYTPKLDRILFWLAIFNVIAAASFVLLSFHMYNTLGHLVAVVFVVVALSSGILTLKQGYRPAKYFLLAITAFLVGLFFRLFRNIGLFPDTFLTVYMVNIGSIIDVTLLSFGLADRINTLRGEKEQVIQKSREQYRRMTRRLLTVQDEERERVAREIHDSMGEYLSTLIVRCGLLKKRKGEDSKAFVKELQEINKLLNEAIEECHRLSFELSPPSISKLGLVFAMKEVIDRFKERSEIPVQFDESIDGDRLTNRQELTFFRILQESLNNIHNHASAQNVKVRFYEEDGYICLNVSDDGKGFYLDEVTQKESDPYQNLKGFGLMSMQERVASINGTTEINSTIGKGTKISLTVPREII